MKIKANISISRSSNNMVNLTLTDEASGIQFVDMQISMSDYASIITGLSHVEIEGEVRGLENVGKLKVREPRRVICPLDTYDRSTLREWLLTTQAEDGWTIDGYLGSQKSIVQHEGQRVLNYAVYKYIDRATP
jgi:hypothetical protein